MVQREIKNKTKLYAVAAILSAILLVSAIYTVTPPTTISVMYGSLSGSSLKNFTSNDELRNYLITNGQVYSSYGSTNYQQSTPGGSIVSGDPIPDGYWIDDSSRSASAALGASEPKMAAPTNGEPEYMAIPDGSSRDPFSTTNTQVVGVDEADIVKTDGQYIYVLSRNRDLGPTIQIVKANSQKPTVVGKISFDRSTDSSTHIDGMYLSENGNKLVLIGQIHDYSLRGSNPYRYRGNDVQTFLYVYDISSKDKPVLERNFALSGNYFNSRMIGNYVYVVVNQHAQMDAETVYLPQICVGSTKMDITPTNIYYTDLQDSSFSYSTFIGLNIIDDTEQPTCLTILTGISSCMYVSTHNMYVTFGKSEGTEIYRVAFNGADLNFRAQGIVPGSVLNQYSMDEYNDYFRIATTVSTGFWNNREEHNNLYVLNLNLDVVGKLENLAQGERIYSARFTGDKAYLVTFKQIDPFFVLDLKNPTSPKVVGELKIPGFSSYMHPYSENFIIGLGQEDSKLKLSLFDVTNMNNPQEVAKYIIGENARYSGSNAQNDPKAFLFDQQKQLLVIPVIIQNYIGTPLLPEPSTLDSDAFVTNSMTASMWQGVYVFKLSPENGFILQGEISHQTTNDNNWSGGNPIVRSLYIGNNLYTISNDMIQLHRLDNLKLIAQVNF